MSPLYKIWSKLKKALNGFAALVNQLGGLS